MRVVATEKLFTQGNTTKTDASLDIAIQGRGFFQIQLPDGSLAYTRDGSFTLNSQGQMVNSSGYVLTPAITVPASSLSITIGVDGTVSALAPGATAPAQIGNIQLADFINETGLQARGENLFAETAASGSPMPGIPGQNGLGTVIQGALETSNVNVVEELVNMIETQRTYEINSRAIETADGMLRYVNNNL